MTVGSPLSPTPALPQTPTPVTPGAMPFTQAPGLQGFVQDRTILTLDGQPISPERAAIMRQELMADPKFSERIALKDAAAFEQHTKLWRLERGLPETPQAPTSVADLEPEIDAKVAAMVQQHNGVLEKQGFDYEQRLTILGRRPLSQEEKSWHENQYEARRRDSAFMAKWAAGDMEAVRIIRTHAVAKSLPVGTLADIQNWEGN